MAGVEVICAWQLLAEPVAMQHDVLAVEPQAVSAQSRPHCPQFVTLERSASQPSQGSLSQLPHPVAQVGTQAPLVLHEFPDWLAGFTWAEAPNSQGRLHAPQCVLLLT